MTAHRTIDNWDHVLVSHYKDYPYRITLTSNRTDLEVTWFEISRNDGGYTVQIEGPALDKRAFRHVQIDQAIAQARCMDDHTIALLMVAFHMPICSNHGWIHLPELGFPKACTFRIQ